jgi:hypothetical protein
MATFIDVHSGFIGVTARQLREAHERDLAIEGGEGVHFERAWLDPVRGRVFCLATGPTREAVMRVHRRAGHPTLDVYEIQVEVWPMHDYTAWKVHEDRLHELTREGDASRLAAIAKEGQPRRDPRSVLRRWLSSWQSRMAQASILARRARWAYRRRVTADETRTCALCGEPIEPDEAWMVAEAGVAAHSGCAYRESDQAERDRWMPSELWRSQVELLERGALGVRRRSQAVAVARSPATPADERSVSRIGGRR